jgi:hypothetical protein
LFIPDPDPYFLTIPDPRSKKAPDPGSATLFPLLLPRLLPYLVVLLFEKVLGTKLEDGVKLVFAERLAGLLGCPVPQHRCPRRVHSEEQKFVQDFLKLFCGSRWKKRSIVTDATLTLKPDSK